MLAVRSRILLILAGASMASAWAANFGTVVPINGTVSDVALDERRNVVWAVRKNRQQTKTLAIVDSGLILPSGHAPVNSGENLHTTALTVA